MLSDEQNELPSSVKTVHEPVIPINPASRERGGGRPPLTQQDTTEHRVL
jgi:hypothetical protein